MPDRVDVIGLGAVVIDHLVMLPAAPDSDTKTVVLDDRFQVGGPTPTALAALSRWGWRCSFAGAWADDAFGRSIEDDFKREGIDHRMSAARALDRTGFAHVWVDQATGSRTIASYRPPVGIQPEQLDHKLLRNTRVLHLDGWPRDAAIEAARIVKQAGGLVTLDTGSPKPATDPLIRLADMVNCPRRFLTQFLALDDIEAAAVTLLDMGPRIVTITDGPRGAVIATRHGLIHKPAHSINAVDTTGAGDVFCGGLIHGLLQNWQPQRMLNFAMAAAALKCRALGNRDALPDVDQVQAMIAALAPASGAERPKAGKPVTAAPSSTRSAQSLAASAPLNA